MKTLIVVLIAWSGLLAACDRDSGVYRQGANEGKAAQSAAGGSSNEGKAAGAAGR
jgi:predicted small secreted protein